MYERRNYMANLEHQKSSTGWREAGRRWCHRGASDLQMDSKTGSDGEAAWKTTAFRCFQRCQQHNNTTVERACGEKLEGGVTVQRA